MSSNDLLGVVTSAYIHTVTILNNRKFEFKNENYVDMNSISLQHMLHV